jgi:hypothetical protein
MAIQSISTLPFYGSYPTGYSLPTVPGATTSSGSSASSSSSSSSSSTSASSASPATALPAPDLPAGTFTSLAGDTYSISALFQAQQSGSDPVSRYEVAIRGDGQLYYNSGTPATSGAIAGPNASPAALAAFAAAGGTVAANEVVASPTLLSSLYYVAGAVGSDIVAVAQSDVLSTSGSVIGSVDSPAIQVTGLTASARSINALAALVTSPVGNDAQFVQLAQESTIFTGFGANKPPTIASVGNFTGAQNDLFGLSGLFAGTDPSSAANPIARYEIALRGDGAFAYKGGLITGPSASAAAIAAFTAAGGTIVGNRITVAPALLGNVQFSAGASTSDIVAVAQSDVFSTSGSVIGAVDSKALQITADTTGTRSINALGALDTTPLGNDAQFVSLGQEANIFSGFGTNKRPGLASVGDITAVAGDIFNLASLYAGADPAGGVNPIARYELALRGDGAFAYRGGLITGPSASAAAIAAFTAAGGTIVGNQITVNPTLLSNVEVSAGATSSDVIAVAQSDVFSASGGVIGTVDSQGVQLTVSTTGTRSLNSLNALSTNPLGSDAQFVALGQEANIFSGFGTNKRPTVSTVGNFTSANGDLYRIGDLYKGTDPAGGTNPIARYEVAVRGDGALAYQGSALTGPGAIPAAVAAFTAAGGSIVGNQVTIAASLIGQLQFQAGSKSSDLLVVAQSDVLSVSGSVIGTVDSQAVQITATTTGARSVNAAGALATTPLGTDANLLQISQEAGIFSGFGANTRPGLTSLGNLTAAPSDKFSVSDLFKGADPTGGNAPIARYEVAVDGAAQLFLNGVNVTNQITFTPSEFASLQFVTSGVAGDTQRIGVVAQSDVFNSSGGAIGSIDSQAVVLTATNSVTGLTSSGGTVNVGGAGYAIGDLVTVAGGTVAYSGSTVPAGITAGLSSIAIDAGGTGYAVGDTITLAGGSGSDNAILKVTSIGAGGAITGVSIQSAGLYTVGAAQFVPGASSGSGSGAIFDTPIFDTATRLRVTSVGGGGAITGLGPALAGTYSVAPALSANAVTGGAGAGAAVNLTGYASVADPVRSINAIRALSTTPLGGDAAFVELVQEASIFTGFGSHTPASIQTIVHDTQPLLTGNALAKAIGAYQTTGALPVPASTSTSSSSASSSASATSPGATQSPAGPYDVSTLYNNGVGGTATTGIFSSPILTLYESLFPLGSPDLGGSVLSGEDLSLQRFALASYKKTQTL